MKYFPLGPFRFTLPEVFSYRAISFVWREVPFTRAISFHLRWSEFSIVLHELLPIRAIWFYLTCSIIVSSYFICLIWSTSYSTNFKTNETARSENMSCKLPLDMKIFYVRSNDMARVGSASCKTNQIPQNENTSCKLKRNGTNLKYFV